MNIRLDSTSPVRQIQCDDVRPKINKPEIKNFDYQECTKADQANFKPRSVMNESQSGITKISGSKSTISSVPQQNSKLLKKEVANNGSYLNAESLELINKSKPRVINTPNFDQKIIEEPEEESFSNYQEIANEIACDSKSKQNANIKCQLPINKSNHSKNRKPGDPDDDYEYDFHES